MAPALPARVALIGFMGAGKSTVGRLLAARLGYAFVDLDREIEEGSGKAIREIFSEQGEEAFRRLETDTLVALSSRRRVVVAAGGGAPMQPENSTFFRETTTFYLEIGFEEFLRRTLANPARPLRGRPEEELRALYQRRRPLYRELGEVIRGEGRSPREVVEEILERLAQE